MRLPPRLHPPSAPPRAEDPAGASPVGSHIARAVVPENAQQLDLISSVPEFHALRESPAIQAWRTVLDGSRAPRALEHYFPLTANHSTKQIAEAIFDWHRTSSYAGHRQLSESELSWAINAAQEHLRGAPGRTLTPADLEARLQTSESDAVEQLLDDKRSEVKQYLQRACPKAVEAYTQKLEEVSTRPSATLDTKPGDGGRFTAEDVEMISPRLMDALPVLIVPDLLSHLQKHGTLGIEVYDQGGNTQRLGELRDAVNSALKSRPIGELVRDTHAALETSQFDHDPHLRRICVLIHGIAANAATVGEESHLPAGTLSAPSVTSRQLNAAMRELAYEEHNRSQS